MLCFVKRFHEMVSPLKILLLFYSTSVLSIPLTQKMQRSEVLRWMVVLW